jgi:hypothetical protein
MELAAVTKKKELIHSSFCKTSDLKDYQAEKKHQGLGKRANLAER